MTTQKLLEKRAGLVKEARALCDAATKAKRDLTAEEREKFDKLLAEADILKGQADQMTRLEGLETELTTSRGRQTISEPLEGPRLLDPDGREIRCLRPEERLAGLYPAKQATEFRLGHFLRGLVSGNWQGAEAEQRQMVSSTGAYGSLLVPEAVSSDIWDRARAAAVTFKAGALTVPMAGPKLLIGRLEQSGTPAWTPELKDATETTLRFGGVELQARTLRFWMVFSRELFEDAHLLENQVRDDFGKVAAEALDRACLVGSGSGEEPQGLLSNAAVTKTAVATGLFADVSAAIYRIEAENGTAPTVVWSPRTAQYRRMLLDEELRFLPDPTWWPPQTLVSTMIPENLGDGTDESLAIVGDFRNIVVGIRSEFTLEVTKEGEALAKKFGVGVLAAMRADVAVMRPQHIEVVTGVTDAWTGGA